MLHFFWKMGGERIMEDFHFPNSTIRYHFSSSQCLYLKKNKDRRQKMKQSHAMQSTNYVWLSQAPRESILGVASYWDLIHANAGSLCVAGLHNRCSEVPRDPYPGGYGHLPRELPPALAGQTEPSPSS